MTKSPTIVQLARQDRLREVLSPTPRPTMTGLEPCLSVDPDLFFAEGDFSTRRAVQLCSSCPVLSRCRKWAIEQLDFGVAGGLNSEDRAKARNGRHVLPDSVKGEALDEYRFFISHSIKEIALKFGVTERQAVRWRNLLIEAIKVA